MRNTMFAIAIAVSAAAGAAESNLSTTTIEVTGMTCGSCAVAVKHVLKNIDGVRDVRVSYKEGEAIVSYDAAKITPQRIADAAKQNLPGYAFSPHATSSSRTKVQPSQIENQRVSFYEIGLVCAAAPKIGCGGHSKPVLSALQKDPHIAGSWINEAGTRLAIGWKSAEVLSSEQINQIISGFGVAANEVSSDARPKLLKTFHTNIGWFDAASVDRLSEQEAGIIASRLVKRLTAKASITPAQQDSLRDGMARALRANFIEGDERDLDEQLIATAKTANLSGQATGLLREVVALGIYPLVNEQ
jgi:copper chaperone CopZ